MAACTRRSKRRSAARTEGYPGRVLRRIAPSIVVSIISWVVSATALAEPRAFTAEVEGGPAIPMGFSADTGPAIGAGAGWFVLPDLVVELRAIGSRGAPR